MKSGSDAELIRLLLQQSDRHPIRSIGAADLKPYDPRFVRTLRNLGILTEREDLRDDGATIFQVVDDALIVVDPETGACEREGDALDIRAFDIDIGAICRAIREQSGLVGPGPSAISTRVWRLGRYVRQDRSAEICLVRRLREATAQEVVDHVRGAIDTEASVTLISLGRIDLPTAVARQLDAMRMTVAVAEDLMGQVQGSPFAMNLDRVRLASSMPAAETRLVVDRTGRRVIFDGLEISIEPRDFDGFVLLAEEAADVGGWVLRDSIAAALRASTRRDANPEQVDRCIYRLRNAFRKSASEIEAPGHPLIETKPKVGYRLTLAAPEIGFMA